METIKINTSQHIEIDYPVAGLGERVAAYLIDFGMFLIIYFFALIALAITEVLKLFLTFVCLSEFPLNTTPSSTFSQVSPSIEYVTVYYCTH